MSDEWAWLAGRQASGGTKANMGRTMVEWVRQRSGPLGYGKGAAVAGFIMTMGVVLGVEVAGASEVFPVTQKDRAFHPSSLTIERGDIVQVINDDGELLHHAYVKSPTFNFDSGEQDPGSKTNIRFTEPGTFTVLCAIHPKMRLTVQVK